jgi:hypothetical protein
VIANLQYGLAVLNLSIYVTQKYEWAALVTIYYHEKLRNNSNLELGAQRKSLATRAAVKRVLSRADRCMRCKIVPVVEQLAAQLAYQFATHSDTTNVQPHVAADGAAGGKFFAASVTLE